MCGGDGMEFVKREMLGSCGGVVGSSASGYMLFTSSSDEDERICESPSTSVRSSQIGNCFDTD